MTTYHTNDYRDTAGDAAAGRVTLPIAHPSLSRVVTALILIAWSCGISWTWRLDDIAAGFMGVLALTVGVNLVTRTDGHADIISSYLYAVSSTVLGYLSVAYAIVARPGFVRRVYSPDIIGCAWYRNRLVLRDWKIFGTRVWMSQFVNQLLIQYCSCVTGSENHHNLFCFDDIMEGRQ